MNRMGYAVEKLGIAVELCMSSERSLQERLIDSYLSFHTLSQGSSLPPDLQERLNAMIDACSTEPAIGNEGRIAATVTKMSDDEARKWLNEIFSIYTDTVELNAKNEVE